MWTTSGNNHESFREQPNQAYISTDAFASEFYSYVVSRDSNLVSRGTLSLVLTSDPTGKAPKGRVLHGNGKKLIPGVNPMDVFPSGTGVTARTLSAKTLLTGVYDPVTGLKGFIDLSSPMFKKFDTNSPASFDLGLNGVTPASSGVYVPGSLGGTSEAVSYNSSQDENLVRGNAANKISMYSTPSTAQVATYRTTLAVLTAPAATANTGVAYLISQGVAVAASASGPVLTSAKNTYSTGIAASITTPNTSHKTAFDVLTSAIGTLRSVTIANTAWGNYTGAVTAYNSAVAALTLGAAAPSSTALQTQFDNYVATAATAVAEILALQPSPLFFVLNDTRVVPALNIGNVKSGMMMLPGSVAYYNGVDGTFNSDSTFTGTVVGNSIVLGAAASAIGASAANASTSGSSAITPSMSLDGVYIVSPQIRPNSILMISDNSTSPGTQFSITPFNGYALIRSSVATSSGMVSFTIVN
jgi:hypothetical protein